MGLVDGLDGVCAWMRLKQAHTLVGTACSVAGSHNINSRVGQGGRWERACLGDEGVVNVLVQLPAAQPRNDGLQAGRHDGEA